jgi:hypothetical protein
LGAQVSDELFDPKELEKENEDKDPLDIKERLFVQKYSENLILGVKAPKKSAYAYAYYDGANVEDLGVSGRGDVAHGIKASMTPKWRMIEKKLGFTRLAHDLGLDNLSLLNKLKELMETQRPMMQKMESGSQEPVWYPDGQVQLKATETLIKLANQLSVNDKPDSERNTLSIVFSGSDKVSDWSNVEVFQEKKEDEIL